MVDPKPNNRHIVFYISMKRYLAHSFFLVVFVSLAHLNAEISWMKSEIDVVAKKGASEYETQFTFVNRNTVPIKIISAKASCGCTVSKIIQTNIPPGRKGYINVKFSFGQRQGKHTKRIIVETDDKVTPVSQLILTVDIPKVFHAEPSEIVLQAGLPLVAVTINLTTDLDAGLRLHGVRVTDPVFHVEIRSENSDGSVELLLSAEKTVYKSAALVVDYLDKNDVRRSFVVPLVSPDAVNQISHSTSSY